MSTLDAHRALSAIPTRGRRSAARFFGCRTRIELAFKVVGDPTSRRSTGWVIFKGGKGAERKRSNLRNHVLKIKHIAILIGKRTRVRFPNPPPLLYFTFAQSASLFEHTNSRRQHAFAE